MSGLNPVPIPPSNRGGGRHNNDAGAGLGGLVGFGGFGDGKHEHVKFVVKELNRLEVFKLGIFTGLAFSVVFIVSDSIPIFVEEMSDSFSDSAVRGISIGIWLAFSAIFVCVTTRT